MKNIYPIKILHWINNKETVSGSDAWLNKINPANGLTLSQITSGNKIDADIAVSAALNNFNHWKNIPVIQRADIIRRAALLMEKRIAEISEIVHLETGKSLKDVGNEAMGAFELGLFYAGEGRRYYGIVTSSSIPNRQSLIIREPVGIAALIVPFNTPIANVAWKSFPALLCGNTVVLKASSDTPYTAVWFAKILKEAGLPRGVFNVVQGRGSDIGIHLIENNRINLISFTGSTETGKLIAEKTAGKFVKTSLEMGGKNPFVVADDCDLGNAVDFAIASSFSNAGQRCASASRIIVFSSVYEQFKKLFMAKVLKLKVGISDGDDYGPVINERQLNSILALIASAKKDGAKILTGGKRLLGIDYRNGYFLEPTVIEESGPDSELSKTELFGPVTSLYRVSGFNEALAVANGSKYGLTSSFHSNSLNRIQEFIKRIEAGVVSINGPSHGSEPHLPFGGVKQSGNGFKEPGPAALDFYSNSKTVYIRHDPSLV